MNETVLSPLEGTAQLFVYAFMITAQFFGAVFLNISCFSPIEILGCCNCCVIPHVLALKGHWYLFNKSRKSGMLKEENHVVFRVLTLSSHQREP
jgi:hypothetical protein